MTSFKSYLGYRLKRSLFQVIIFSFLAVSFACVTAHMSAGNGYGSMGIEYLATVTGIIASIIPMDENSIFKSRRNLDTLFFFPISRKSMALAHYLSGLLQMFAIYTVAFIGHFISLLKYSSYFRLEYMPLYYVLLLALGIVVYSIFTFLFAEANSMADGIICAVLWAFALYVAAIAVAYPVRILAERFVFGTYDSSMYWAFSRRVDSFATWFLPHAPINNLTVVFQSVMEGWEDFNGCELYYPTFAEAIARNFPYWYMVFPWIAAGAASVWGYFRTFARKSAEKAGDISTSPLCYKTLIPLLGASMVILTAESGAVMFFIIVAAMYIGYAIYRRSFKIKKADVITTAAVSLVSMALLLIINIIAI